MSAELVALNSDSAESGSSMLSTVGVQSAAVTYRMWRMPPVSWALVE